MRNRRVTSLLKKVVTEVQNAVQLYRTYDLTTRFKFYDRTKSPCECISRADGERLRICRKHNHKVGTHGRTRVGGAE